MNSQQDMQIMLQQLNIPAFLVTDGHISAVNLLAQQRLAEVGASVAPMISLGAKEYAKLTKGCLYITICLGGKYYRCTVTSLKGCQLFQLETETVRPELQALALAAQQLSIPLSNLAVLSRNAGASSDDNARITQTVYQLQRLVGNMADAADYAIRSPQLRNHSVGAVLSEMLEKSGWLLEQAGLKLQYQMPKQNIFMALDTDMLQRAVMNLLSNAAKFSPAGGTVDVKVKADADTLRITVANETAPNSTGLPGSIFTRFQRQAGLEDRNAGLGLGMTVVHAVAAAHGGTVLIEKPSRTKIRVTMTLNRNQIVDDVVRSPILRPDIYGGRDQMLVELSDILPAHLYENEL